MSSNNGGILRSAAKQKKKSVSFSARDDDYVNHHHNSASSNAGHNDEYDSDEVEDAILASGDGLSSMMERRHNESDNNNMMDDDNNGPAVHNSLEIEEAKRKRGRVRRNEDFGGDVDGTSGGGDFDNDNHNDDNDNTLSLITDHGANPDTYESNAGGNASCPVEPFNMNAEQESGMGYFDGDTYVFRHNSNKPVDGEEDAWLDGFKGDNDDDDDENEEEAKSGNVGGLDSTAIYKPNSSYTKTNNDIKQKEKFKFIDENATPEDIGRRVITLLQSEDETVMKALSRLGSQLREMQAKEQKLKKSKIRTRKSKGKQETVVDNASTAASSASDADEEMKNLSIQMEQTRKVVEELTELADALLFGGEADSYELTKADWVHRFKLLDATSNSDLMRKRPVDDHNITADAKPEAKKQRRGYFDVTTTNDADANGDSSKMSQQHEDQVMWEYKGNEDGSIHGPYTSKQMLEWTSCGYFVGESAVDIRRVGSLSSNVASNKKKVDETTTPPPKTDVDDLMADLESDEEDNDDDEGGGGSENATVNAESSWMRSDRVDFSLYL